MLRSASNRRQGYVSSAASMTTAALTLVITIGAAAWGIAAGGTLHGAAPDPVTASAPAAEFSSARALNHIRIVAREPHPMGSPANAAVRDYLVSELSRLRLTPHVQRATAAYYPVPGNVQAGTSENVLARLRGTNGDGKSFLIAAHYDSVPTSPGATDNGAGVAALLETLRALKAGPVLRNDVIFLFTDGEERGLLGARAFLDQHPWAQHVGVVLNLDTRGNPGPALMLATNDESGWLVDEFAKAAPYPMTTSDAVASFRRSGGNSDLSVFLDAGLAGLQVSTTGGVSHYHGALDNVDELDERSLQHLGSYALALTRQFGSVSLEQTRAPDAVYFNVSKFLVQYSQAWVIPLTVFTFVLAAGVVALGLRRRHLRLGGMGLGFVALPVAMAGAALVAHLTWTLMLRLHADGIWAFEYRPAIIWIGLASLTVALTATLYGVLGSRVRVLDLAVGALLWWLILAVVTSVVFPPITYFFTWPLVFSLLGLGMVFASKESGRPAWLSFAVLLITGIPAAFLAASGVYGITMTRELLLPYVAPMFAAGIVLMLGLLVPHIGLVGQVRRWILPVAAALLALAVLLAGGLRAGFDAQHPRPDTVLYALNLDTGQAIWESPDDEPDAWSSQFFGANPEKSSVAEYFGDPDPRLHSPAPTASLPGPKVQLLDISTANGVRSLRLHASGPAGANFIMVQAGSEVTGVAIDGKPVPNRPVQKGSGSSIWTLNFWNPPKRGIDLTLHVPVSGDPATIEQDSSTVVSKSFTFPTSGR